MSFSQNEKETKEVNKNINEAKPITLEEYNNKKSDMNQIKEKNNSKKKILTIKNTFDLRKKHFQINKDIYRRMMKNKTQGELEHFRNNSFKKFFEVKKGLNTLHHISNFNTNLNKTFGYFDKEQIKSDLNKMKNELKKINEELTYLKNEEEESKNKLIGNKLIIEKILKINDKEKEEENNNNINDDLQNRNEKNNNNYIGSYNSSNIYLTQLKQHSNEITKDETKENNNSKEILNLINQEKNIIINNNYINLKHKNKTTKSFPKKNNYKQMKYIKIKNRLKVNNFSRLLSTLKREISDYDKSIKSTSKLIESKKSTGKVNIFLNLNNFIEDKNKTLGVLTTKKNSLSENLTNDNKKICLLIIRTNKIIEDQKKTEKLINMNITLTQEFKKDIERMKKDKEKLMNELDKLQKEKNNMMKIKEQKEKEKKILDEKFKKEEIYYKEKKCDEKEIDDIHHKEIIIKKNITKNDININIIKNNIKYDENLIKDYLTTIKLYNAYININRQIKRVKEGKDKNTEKSQENSKLNLNKELNELFHELTEKNALNKKLQNELDELKKEYKTKIQNKETDFEKDEINSPNNIDTSNINKNKDINKSEKKKDCVIF